MNLVYRLLFHWFNIIEFICRLCIVSKSLSVVNRSQGTFLMTDKMDIYVNKILKITDSILEEGWNLSENDLLNIIGKQKSVDNFGRAFNSAVQNTFSDCLIEILNKNKIPDNFFKGNCPHGYSNFTNPSDFVKKERLNAKLQEVENLQLLINIESQKLLEQKQKLQFLISSIKKNKKELDLGAQYVQTEVEELDFLKNELINLNC